MEREQVIRITEELEDLLMKEENETEQAQGGRAPMPEGGEEAVAEGRPEGAEEAPEADLTAGPQAAPESQSDSQTLPASPQGSARRMVAAKFHGVPEGGCRKGWEARKDRIARTERAARVNLVRPNDALIAAFVVPVVVMLVIFAQRGIFPFGEETFLRTDMYHQYAPFFSEFQNKLKEGGSLLYSWNVGMGINFSALYAYYLASPINWVLIFCPRSLTLEFMTYLIVVKTGLCGLSMAWYLRRHCKTQDFGIAFFGIFYALSGYMAAYSWNIMWLDCILLFPVIVYGLERLVRSGKGMLYCVALGISILSNYYISIMTCIFMVLYFLALLVLERRMSWEKFLPRSAKFALYSLLAGGLAAAVLLPEVFALQMTASGDINFPKTFTQYFSIFDMIARHIGNVETEIGLDHWPNVYCGVAVLMFALLYVLCRKIPVKEKAVYGILLLFFYASFSMNVLNFIWHGFHYPNSLPCRQSYIYIFLVLLMCYRAYMYLEETPRRHLLAAFWGAVAFVILAQKLVTEEHFHFIVYYVAVLVLALYLAVIYLYRKGPRYRMRALVAGLALVAVEAGANMAVTSVTTTSRTSYKKDNAAVEALVDQVLPGDSFFRMEKVTRKTKNDGAWMHFPSVSLFSSTANADLSKLFKKLGCESSTNAYSITGATPLIDMLFAVRYGIYSEEQKSPLHEFVAQQEETWLYENRYTLPVGYVVTTNFDNVWSLDVGNPADVQNNLATILGAEPVLETVLNTDADGKTLSFFPEESGEYFAYIGNKKIEKVKAATESGSKTFNNVDRGYLVELGYCPSGFEVTLSAENSSEDMWADVYRVSEEGLRGVYEALSREPWQLSSWTDTSLAGSVECGDYGLLMTTVPYDEGWTVLVDGKKQELEKVLDAFCGVRLKPGRHEVSMSYRPKGLKEGFLISFASVAVLTGIFAGGCCLGKRRRLSGARTNEIIWK